MSSRSAKDYYSDKSEDSQNICELEREGYSPSAMSEMSEDDFKRFLDRAEGIEPLPETVETAPETSVAAEPVETAPARDEGFSEPEPEVAALPKADPRRIATLREMFQRDREKKARKD